MAHELTDASKAFIASVPKGAWYVCSREGQGFGFSGEAREDAQRLSVLNFERAGMIREAEMLRARQAERPDDLEPAEG